MRRQFQNVFKTSKRKYFKRKENILREKKIFQKERKYFKKENILKQKKIFDVF